MLKNMFGRFIRRCASTYISRQRPYIIGITGSIGKTTSRMIISHVLWTSLPDVRISTSPKNFNSEIGLSLSILEIQSYSPTVLGTISAIFQWLTTARSPKSARAYEVVVLEYGIDQPGDMDILLDIAVPHMAIFTGLDKVHGQNFDSPDQILEEKSKLLFAATDIVCVPGTANYLDQISEEIEVDVLTFALHHTADADISFDEYTLRSDDTHVAVSSFALDQWHTDHDKVGHISTNLIWEVFAGYVSLWVELAMIVAIRFEVEYVLPESFTFDLQPGRFWVYSGMGESVIVDSSYNAAPESMKMTILQTIQLRNTLYTDHKLIYCIGDMNELGDFSESEHRKLALLITQSAEYIYLIGDQTHYLADECQKIGYNMDRIIRCDDARDLWVQVATRLQQDNQRYLVMCKASQWWLYIEEAIPFLLSDTKDIQKLPRQDERWTKKKNLFFGKK